MLVNGLLVESLPGDRRAPTSPPRWRSDLDKVEEGRAGLGARCCSDFYGPFQHDLEKAKVEMRDVKREEIPTEHVCEKCGKPMVIKWGRNGAFLACPATRSAATPRSTPAPPTARIEVVARRATTDEVCETCGAPMMIKRGRFG